MVELKRIWRRPSLRVYTVVLVGGLLAAVGILLLIERDNAARRARTAAVVQREVNSMAYYQDARIAVLDESRNIAGYRVLGDERYIAGFEDARVAGERALDALDALAPGEEDERSTIAELRETHNRLSTTLGRILDRLRQDDVAGVASIAASSSLTDDFEILLRLLKSGTDAARLDVAAAQQQDRTDQARARALALMAFAAWTLLIGGTVVAHFRWVVRPIEHVGDAARAIARGQVSARAPSCGPSELAHLGLDVNRMADALIRRAEVSACLSSDLEARTAELERANAALDKSERRFRSLVQNATDIMTVIDASGRLQYASPSVERVLGYGPEQQGKIDGLSMVHPDDLPIAIEALRRVRTHPGRHPPIELRVRHADGSWRWLESTPTNLLDDPVVHGIVHNSRDITERKRFESRLLDQARHDSLTGLLNGRSLREELDRCIAHAHQTNTLGAAVFLDLDGFKDVNDTLGHRAGDELLVELADLLRAELRDVDIVSRIGGDEFVLVLPEVRPEDARALAERLLGAIRHRSFRAAGHPLSVTASIGITLFPDHARSADDVLADADLAMYRSKRDGRNRVSMYVAGMESPGGDRLDWQRRLRDALDGGRLLLYAQPVVEMRSRHIVGYELLLRLRGDDGQVLLPGAFLRDAESTGLLHEIDRWVVRQAMRIAAASQTQGREVRFSANLSSKAFSDPELLALVRQERASTGLDPWFLIFEVTEDAAMTDIDQARRFVEELQAMGFQFALDDFGVGFSSLSRLKLLPVDYLKIDGNFVQELPRHSVDQHLVQAMVTLARALGKMTVAEFVQDEETLVLLQSYGVDFAQGFHLGEPAPLEHWLSREQRAA